ncbi:MAG TPA: copper chaperone PCu(A)C [Gammaproteobacteria bacterium]|nr:copper chaperone PCu(A)C [Gammaproteobacteria bacterium]
MKFPRWLLLGWCLTVAAVASQAAPTMDITNAWVRESPPTSRVLAGYLQISNLTDADLTVTGVTSPDFESAELHRTVIEDGMARMLPVPELTVPAGGSVLLEPGGLHLMLFDPARTLLQGDSVTLVLHRSDGICLTLSVPVLRSSGEAHSDHHH